LPLIPIFGNTVSSSYPDTPAYYGPPAVEARGVSPGFGDTVRPEGGWCHSAKTV